ncbi:MAG: DUF2207 domain-containing protein [Candidatus Beckwithbacteria bacterium]|nr:DUF2207 domain-containing protein [Candidatus Beckwithbacteria bacterium]
MKKILISLLIWLLFPVSSVLAADYTVDNFKSLIEINQDTSLTVTETIEANFNVAKHGIFRIIPVIYSANGRTINGEFKLLSINAPYSSSRFNQSIKLQIGDPNKTIIGKQTYVIKYQLNNILQRYPEHDELYWNVTGHEWDTTIATASAEVISPFAPIIKRQDYNEGELTIAVALDKNSQLIWPTKTQMAAKTTINNWGYPVALLPVLVMFGFWLKKGRDKRYTTDNLYVKGQKTKTVAIFEHKFLPSVYSPIDNLTPSEAGTILDQKVDTKDVVAEIIELGRLGFLTIKRTEVKKFLYKNTDYVLTKQNKDTKNLRNYQKYLLEKIFGNKQTVKLSEMKNSFYQYLEEFRKKVNQYLADEKIFDGNPKQVKTKWTGIGFLMMAGGLVGVINFASLTANSGPIGILALTLIPLIMLVKNMPARTAWGYSLLRQIEGLKWYLGKGKWREEIAEKNLFLGDMLPLAIALGVVNQLAKDMAGLGIPPPSYLQGFSVVNFNSQLNHLTNNSTAAIISSPSGSKWSGSSSWSGGSGFSGGSSGGGFGGGGGGSW